MSEEGLKQIVAEDMSKDWDDDEEQDGYCKECGAEIGSKFLLCELCWWLED